MKATWQVTQKEYTGLEHFPQVGQKPSYWETYVTTSQNGAWLDKLRHVTNNSFPKLCAKTHVIKSECCHVCDVVLNRE